MFLRVFFFLVYLLLAGSDCGHAEQPLSGQLTVNINDIKPTAGGNLRIALFQGEQGWPKMAAALQSKKIPATGQQLSVQFEKLPYADNYAIEVHHDENNNGKFDMRWFPYPRPKEGVGVSNNIFGFGHPDFSDARFILDGPVKTIEIRMRY